MLLNRFPCRYHLLCASAVKIGEFPQGCGRFPDLVFLIMARAIKSRPRSHLRNAIGPVVPKTPCSVLATCPFPGKIDR